MAAILPVHAPPRQSRDGAVLSGQEKSWTMIVLIFGMGMEKGEYFRWSRRGGRLSAPRRWSAAADCHCCLSAAADVVGVAWCFAIGVLGSSGGGAWI